MVKGTPKRVKGERVDYTFSEVSDCFCNGICNRNPMIEQLVLFLARIRKFSMGLLALVAPRTMPLTQYSDYR